MQVWPMGAKSSSEEEGRSSFIVFSDDWGEHPSSSQHMFRHIAQEHDVLWVNTIGMRGPELSWVDARKAWRKLGRMFRTNARSGEPNSKSGIVPTGVPRLVVLQPFMLPFGFKLARLFNRRQVIRAVRRAAKTLALTQPIVVSTVPNAGDYVDGLSASRIVYYCPDDFTQWPGLDHTVVRDMEDTLIAKSDVLVATSRKLLQRFESSGAPAHLLTHGVDLELFAAGSAAAHPCVADLPRPRIGYFGLFDARSDQELIARLAAAMPAVSFVVTGPVVVDAAALRAAANVFFTGSVGYADLPALAAGLDVLFLPYVVNDFTESISPLKLKEYLATGKPVVSSPLPEANALQPFVRIASSAEQWHDALQTALRESSSDRREAVRRALQGESWAAKARLFLRICQS